MKKVLETKKSKIRMTVSFTLLLFCFNGFGQLSSAESEIAGKYATKFAKSFMGSCDSSPGAQQELSIDFSHVELKDDPGGKEHYFFNDFVVTWLDGGGFTGYSTERYKYKGMLLIDKYGTTGIFFIIEGKRYANVGILREESEMVSEQ